MELAQQFEYVVQKPNAEFWAGLAVGRGCQIYVPFKCRMFSGPLYGWRYPDAVSERKQWDDTKAEWEKRVAKGIEGADKALKAHLESFRVSDDAVDDDNVGIWDPYIGDEGLNLHIYKEPPLVDIVPEYMKTLHAREFGL
jgi:hypothetical protein